MIVCDNVAGFSKRVRYSIAISRTIAVIVFVLGVTLMTLAAGMFGPKFDLFDYWVHFMTAVFTLPLSCAVSYLPARQVYESLRWKVVLDDETHCLTCDYNLTGLPEPRCPECGRPFEPKGEAK